MIKAILKNKELKVEETKSEIKIFLPYDEKIKEVEATICREEKHH